MTDSQQPDTLRALFFKAREPVKIPPVHASAGAPCTTGAHGGTKKRTKLRKHLVRKSGERW